MIHISAAISTTLSILQPFFLSVFPLFLTISSGSFSINGDSIQLSLLHFSHPCPGLLWRETGEVSPMPIQAPSSETGSPDP